MSKCHPEDPFFVTITHYLSSLFSMPIYATTFLVLIFKCPKYFNSQYRNLLIAHLISGVLLEVHVSIFWRGNVPLPIPIVCSNGLASNFPAEILQVFVVLMAFTGSSAVSILIHRMRAAILHAEKFSKLHKLPIIFLLLFYLFCTVTIIFTFLIKPALKQQEDFKQKMESKFGTFPEHFWCQNCFFMVFDNPYFVSFFIFAYLCVASAFISAGSSAFVTYQILHSKSLKLSEKTAKIQRNVLFSLLAAFLVHVVLLLLPLSVYFSSHFIYIDFPLAARASFIMVQEHGAASALTLLLTSNLLRKSVKQLFTTTIKLVKAKEVMNQRNEVS